MKKIHICYANNRYLNSQIECSQSALKNGFDESIRYSINDVDLDFLQSNSYTFMQHRGAGYWLWKPYLILKTLLTMNDEDWLFYSDSGLIFLRNVWEYIEKMEEQLKISDKVSSFAYCNTNNFWTKRDTFVLMNCDEEKYTNGLHRTASFFLCKKNNYSINFVKEWLQYAKDPRILTDLPNTQGLPNYPEFKDHRHDQSIMSLLSIKNEAFLLDDITQYNTKNDPYVFHHRNGR